MEEFFKAILIGNFFLPITIIFITLFFADNSNGEVDDTVLGWVVGLAFWLVTSIMLGILYVAFNAGLTAGG